MKPKHDLRARALELRREGASLNEIVAELGIAKSTASTWVRAVRLDPANQRDRQLVNVKRLHDRRWGEHRARKVAIQRLTTAEGFATVGELTERELILLGAAIYWCEGAKSKPWRELQTLDFINSDPGLIEVYLRFLAACGITHEEIKCRLTIHETADAEAATAWWKQRLGLHDVQFGRPTIKRHKPTTVRRNINDDYHGCLIVRLGRRREIYWLIEGLMSGIVAGANRSSPAGEG